MLTTPRGTEFRRDVDLPLVEATEDRVDEVMDLLERVIDFELPGFAMVESPEVVDEEEVGETHVRHKRLAFTALSASTPRLNLDLPQFKVPARSDFAEGFPTHLDLGVTPLSQPKMILTFHTPSMQGTHANLANGRSISEPGDDKLFGSKGFVSVEAKGLGYDLQGRVLMGDAIEQLGEELVTAPEYCEPTMYHHDQRPGTTIVFRSSSGIGPATVHGFRSDHAMLPRPTFVSDINVWIHESDPSEA